MSQDDLLYFNGINGENGQYLFSPMKPEEITEVAKRKDLDEGKDQKDALTDRSEREDEGQLGTVYGVKDPTDLAQAGWGIIFADGDERTRKALAPLLEHRKGQAAAKKEHYYRELPYYHGENKVDFLQDRDAEPYGEADPEKLPYYLLIAGDPTKIPYSFQYQLGVDYAVGRIHFETPEELYQYALNVVQAETNPEMALPRQAAFFGVRKEGDRATEYTTDLLVKPLADKLEEDFGEWQIDRYLVENATKEQLGQLLNGDNPPSLLMTGSHGVGFPNGGRKQILYQGSLLCQDFPGPDDWDPDKELPHDFYFGFDDIEDQAQLLGLIGFHFACYGAGTPQFNDFTHHRGFKEELRIAGSPFVARLPQRLLTRGALAVVGHVERAWTYSFRWQKQTHRQVFEQAFLELMDGNPVGRAMERFASRYANHATFLLDWLDKDIRRGGSADHKKFSRMWTSNNDSRNYVIVGDPAARLRLVDAADHEAKPVRPTITAVEPVAGDNGLPAGADVVAGAGVSYERPASEEELAMLRLGRRKKDPAEERKPSEERSKLESSLKELTDKLSSAISSFTKDVTSLTVYTFVSDEIEAQELGAFDFDAGAFQKGQLPLRALTHIRFDGDRVSVVPSDDLELWEIHREMVEQAQANRNQMLEVLLKTVTGFVNLIG